MSGGFSGGLLPGDSEARIPAGDFPVKVAPLTAASHVGRAEVPQPGLDFLFGAAGAVSGALARGPFALQTLGLRPQAVGPLEERGVALGVGLYRGLDFDGSRGFRASALFPVAQEPEEAAPRPAHRRTQEAQFERR